MRDCDAGEASLNAMELSVVVPAYNEEAALQETILRIDGLLRQQSLSSYEIIIVNDGSVDATLERAEALTASLASCRLISYPDNRGKGHALRQGFLAAAGRLVAFIDADGEYDPQQILPLLSRQQLTSASVVVGKRRVLGFRPWYRRIMSWGSGYVGKMLFGLPTTDVQTGLKVFVKEDVQSLVKLCEEAGYLFDLELMILTHLQGMNVSEVPIEWCIGRPSRITVLSGLASLKIATKLYLRLGSYYQPRQTVSQTIPLLTTNVRRIHALATPLTEKEDSYDAHL